MSQQSKPTSFLVMLVVLAVTLLLVSSLLTPNTAQILPYSDVLDLFRNEKVASFTLEGSNLTMQVRGDDGDTASTVTAKIGNTEQFREDLDALIADQYADGTLESYNYLPVSEPWYRAAAPYIIGGVVLIALFFFLSSRANGGPNGMANFTKANARFGIPTSQTVTFQDVAGADEEKEELAQIVDFLRDPKRYSRLGAKIPKGVLLVGPPGTGKTTLSSCMSASAQAASEICLSRQRRSLPRSSSLTKLTPSVVAAAQVWAADTTNASRRSTSCWSKWTASAATLASLSSPQPTARTSSTRRFSDPVGSTGRFTSERPTGAGARQF